MSNGTDFAAYYEEHGDGRNPMLALLREYVLPHRVHFAAALLIHVVYSLIQVVPPYLIGVAVDLVSAGPASFSLLFVPDAWLPTGHVDQFLLVSALLVGVMVLHALLHGIHWVTWEYLQKHANHEARTDAYDQTQRLGLEFFDGEQTGEIMSVHRDLKFDPILRHFVRPVLRWVTVVFGILGMMALLHWQLTLVIIAILAPTAVIAKRFDERISTDYPQLRRAEGAMNARIRNSISGIVTVKATANESAERETVRDLSRTHRDRSWDVSKSQARYKPLANAFTGFAPVVVLLVGGWWAVFGPPAAALVPLSVGTLVTFFFYAQRFAGSVGNIPDFVDTYHEYDSAARRFLGILAVPPSVPEATNPIDPDALDGRVEYDGVSFAYGDDPVLRSGDLEVSSGAFVGVVGATGAGKSTLCKLLIRFYDPDQGTIRIDGHDLRDLDLATLRGRIGYVAQEPFLFDDSVRDNIAYGDRTAGDEAVVEAAKLANAHEFITEFGAGYDTQVGEDGVKLSGGQRQRVAIARAILKDPDILILDEATSHVDNATEAMIQEGLEELIADRTTIAVAHSLATVREADSIVVLEDGRIAETGTHEDLVDAGGPYETLWRTHLGASSAVGGEPS